MPIKYAFSVEGRLCSKPGWRTCTALLAFLFFALVFAPSSHAASAARLNRTGRDLKFSGTTPFGEVVGLGAWVEIEGLLAFVHIAQATVRDGDGDGVVAWSPGGRAAEDGFYFMADVKTGALGLLGLEGVSGSVVLKVSEDGSLLSFSGFRVTPSYLVVVVVRPGVGVWTLASPDGSKFDRDSRENAAQVFGVQDFSLVGGAGVLDAVLPGDRVVVYDVRSREGSEIELGGR